MEQINLELLNQKVNFLMQQYVLSHEDEILTFDEEKEVEKAMAEYRRGETYSLEDINKERIKNELEPI